MSRAIWGKSCFPGKGGRTRGGRIGLFPFKDIFSSWTKPWAGPSNELQDPAPCCSRPRAEPVWGCGVVSALPQPLHHRGLLALCSHILFPFQDFRPCLCCSLCLGGPSPSYWISRVSVIFQGVIQMPSLPGRLPQLQPSLRENHSPRTVAAFCSISPLFTFCLRRVCSLIIPAFA